jgi:hypothetical protein
MFRAGATARIERRLEKKSPAPAHENDAGKGMTYTGAAYTRALMLVNWGAR